MICQRRLVSIVPLAAALLFACAIPAWAAPGNYPTYTNAAEAGPDFAVQGEYVGEVSRGDAGKIGVQVIALGDGNFRAVVHHGGLPGDGWSRGDKRTEIVGTRVDGTITFYAGNAKATIEGDEMTITTGNGKPVGSAQRVERKSPTLGAKSPPGAIVLLGQRANGFDGAHVDHGVMTIGTTPEEKADGKARGNVYSKQEFGDFELHLEFRSPFMPTALGQARGNSGVYLADRYEVQVLDSFGLEGLNNECGGIYKVQNPKVNMCLPPLSWQTYDIDFTAPRFDDDGNKTTNARVTVRHNGVAIYEDFELPNLTPGGISTEGPSGPLKLQDHGNPVQYRNIWVVEK